ncbi:glycosyltransferase [Cytobacillus horneckiae]|uniref:glycosyltransferase n=1 Tax=Cytobacillus horneckiae TaxID=549687 RepID=UPI0020422708|nr:glycosyltransferase [Cytobacillus horneckiae]MCM3179011.1 glycosyltransferase [Cytobacillus horneckiae]
MRTIYNLLNSIDVKRGGLTRVMFERSSFLAEKGFDSKLLTIDYSTRYQEIEKELHDTGRLSKKVNIINIFDYYKQKNTAGNITLDQINQYTISNKLHEAAYLIEDRFYISREARYFNEKGMYVKYKKWTKEGTLSFIDFFDETRAKVKREIYHQKGYVQKVTYFDRAKGVPKQELYYTEDGFCYINIQINVETNKPYLIFLFDREKQNVISFGTSNPNLLFHAHWLNELCGKHEQKPFLVNDGIFLTHTVMKVDKEKAFRICTIHTNHFDAPFKYGSPLRKSHIHLLENFHQLDALVLLTENQRSMVVKQFGDANNTYVISNSTETDDVKKFKGNKDFNTVSMVGRYHKDKLMHEAIQAFNRIHLKYPNVKFQLYGTGPEEENLINLVKKLNLDDKVIINSYTTDLAKVYGESLFTVLTSKYEGFGLVILESMFQSTPVISYDAPFGPKDIIDDGENGLLVHSNSEKELAEKMEQLLANPDKAVKMGINAHEKVMEKYTKERTQSKWVELFDELEMNESNRQ